MAVFLQVITGMCLLSLLVDATAGKDAQRSCADKKSITFAYIAAKSGALVTSGAKAAVDLALEEINSRNDILPNYTLSYSTIRDSECKGEAAIDAFVEEFAVPYLSGNNMTHLSMLCCGCSRATVPVARISHYWNIPHVAFASATTILNDRQTFKSFFRTVPQYTHLAQAIIIEIVNKYNWTNLFVITQDDPLFVKTTDNLQNLLNTRLSTHSTMFMNFHVRSLPSNITHILEHVWNSNVTFINAYPSIARPILCEAAKSNLTSPVHNWITHGWYPINWWNSTGQCSETQMKTVLNGSLALAPSGAFPLQNDNTKSNLVSKKLYEEKVIQENLTHLEASGLAYDAIWAIALGLHTASMRLKAGDDSGCENIPGTLKQSLEEFDYSNKKMGCVLQESIAKVNFTGITGQIRFNKNGSRVASGNLVMHKYQLRGDDMIKVLVANIHVSAQNEIIISSITSMNDVNNITCTSWNISSDCSAGGSLATANPGMTTFLITLLTTLVCIFKTTI